MAKGFILIQYTFDTIPLEESGRLQEELVRDWKICGVYTSKEAGNEAYEGLVKNVERRFTTGNVHLYEIELDQPIWNTSKIWRGFSFWDKETPETKIVKQLIKEV